MMSRPSYWVARDRGLLMVSYAVVNRGLIGRGHDPRVDRESDDGRLARREGEDENVPRLLERPPGDPSRRPVNHVESMPRSEVFGE
jgi:hypothetical protein